MAQLISRSSVEKRSNCVTAVHRAVDRTNFITNSLKRVQQINRTSRKTLVKPLNEIYLKTHFFQIFLKTFFIRPIFLERRFFFFQFFLASKFHFLFFREFYAAWATASKRTISRTAAAPQIRNPQIRTLAYEPQLQPARSSLQIPLRNGLHLSFRKKNENFEDQVFN